jgi:hypothetical protein
MQTPKIKVHTFSYKQFKIIRISPVITRQTKKHNGMHTDSDALYKDEYHKITITSCTFSFNTLKGSTYMGSRTITSVSEVVTARAETRGVGFDSRWDKWFHRQVSGPHSDSYPISTVVQPPRADHSLPPSANVKKRWRESSVRLVCVTLNQAQRLYLHVCNWAWEDCMTINIA